MINLKLCCQFFLSPNLPCALKLWIVVIVWVYNCIIIPHREQLRTWWWSSLYKIVTLSMKIMFVTEYCEAIPWIILYRIQKIWPEITIDASSHVPAGIFSSTINNLARHFIRMYVINSTDDKHYINNVHMYIHQKKNMDMSNYPKGK